MTSETATVLTCQVNQTLMFIISQNVDLFIYKNEIYNFYVQAQSVSASIQKEKHWLYETL